MTDTIERIGSGITEYERRVRENPGSILEWLSDVFGWIEPDYWLPAVEQDLKEATAIAGMPNDPTTTEYKPHQDFEWYISEACRCVVYIRGYIEHQDEVPAFKNAALYPAFKLGMLLKELEMKFSWEPHALRGAAIAAGGARGGEKRWESRDPVRSPEALRAAVAEELRRKPGKMRAYKAVARHRGVGLRTVERAVAGK